MSAVNRALRIARQARQTGGTAPGQDAPDEQQAAAQSGSYLPSMTAPMGANTADYARISGYNSASALDNAAWQGPPQQPQGGQQAPQAHGPVPPQPPPSEPAQQMSQPQGQPQGPPQTQGPVPHGPVPSQGGPDPVQKLLEAMRYKWGQDQAPTPSKGGNSGVNAAGKNVFLGKFDMQGNEIQTPVEMRAQDAMSNTANAVGLTDALKQKKIQQAQQQDNWSKIFQQAQAALGHHIGNYVGNAQQPNNKFTQFPESTFAQLSPKPTQPQAGKILSQNPAGPLPPDKTNREANNAGTTTAPSGMTAASPMGKPLNIAPKAQAAPTPPQQPAMTMRQMAQKNGADDKYLKQMPDGDQDISTWLREKHNFGLLGGTMTGGDALASGVKYGYLTKDQQQKVYQTAQAEYDRFHPSGAASASANTTDPRAYISQYGGHSQVGSKSGPYGQAIYNADFSQRLMAAGEAYKKETGKDPTYGEGDRDRATQQAYWAQRGNRYDPSNPAAAPGTSLHEKGMAMDIDGDFGAWLQKNGSRFGLANPVPNDAHHFQLANSNQGASAPVGFTSNVNKDIANPQDAGRDYSPGVAPSGGQWTNTAGSAGQGTPQQEKERQRLRFGSWIREIFSGQANPMLPYERAEAENRLFTQWADWDSRRQFQYESASPQEAAMAAVGPNGELPAHKSAYGAALGAQSEAGITHPGGHTLAPGASGAGNPQRMAQASAQDAEQAWGQLSPEQRNVAIAWGNQAQQLADAQKFRATNNPDYVARSHAMMNAATNNQGNLIRQAAETGKINIEKLKEGLMPVGDLGYFDLSRVDPKTGRPPFYSNVGFMKDAASQIKRQEQSNAPAPVPSLGAQPSIGGTGAPQPQASVAGSTPIMPATSFAPSQQATNATGNKPLPASPALEAETKKKLDPKAAVANSPDYLNSGENDRKIPMPTEDDAMDPYSPYSSIDRMTGKLVNKDDNNKAIDQLRERADAASSMRVQLQAILRMAAKAKPGELGPYAHELQEGMGKWNQMARNFTESTGIPLKTFDTNANIEGIRASAVLMAMDLARSTGGGGRAMGQIMHRLENVMPNAEMPEESPNQKAIILTSNLLDVQAARNEDMLSEANHWNDAHLDMRKFVPWFNKAHDEGEYASRAEIKSAFNEGGKPLTNGLVTAAQGHPARQKMIQEKFGLSDEAMQYLFRR